MNYEQLEVTTEGPARLIAGRNIAFAIPTLFGWMFTQTPAGDLLNDPDTHAAVVAVRSLSRLAGLTCHSVAAFNYLGLE